MRVIIVAAGEGSRWGNYKGVPKHLVEVDNETLLHRTVRLLKKYSIIDDIFIVGPNDNRYKINETNLFVPKKTPENFDADKFLSSEELWSKKTRTVIIFGDVFFTDEAIDTIINDNSSLWMSYGRYSGSNITGSKYGEMFGHSFFPNDIEKHKRSLLHVIELVKKRLAKKGNGWEHYRVMQDVPDDKVNIHKIYKNFIEINDWTEDFDYPQDYDMWIERWKSK